MEFEVLGEVHVVRPDGNVVALTGTAQRRLVAAPVAEVGAAVHADTLADLLDLSPGALRTAVSRIRRVVGFDVLVTTPPGYQLRTDRADAVRFERRLVAARTTYDPDSAVRLLKDALALWTGATEDLADRLIGAGQPRRCGAIRDTEYCCARRSVPCPHRCWSSWSDGSPQAQSRPPPRTWPRPPMWEGAP